LLGSNPSEQVGVCQFILDHSDPIIPDELISD
jgi:hypothetical protein